MTVIHPQGRLSSRLPTVSKLSLVLAAGLALAACGKDEPAPAPGADVARTTAAAPAPTPETAVSSKVSALGVDELRTAARTAYAENRLYAPTEDNALEYYLALRDKSPGDASVASALTDLLPITVIATEQSITREDFDESRRLVALLEKAEPSHPALDRLKSSIGSREQAAVERAELDQVTAEEQTLRKAELERERLAEQQRQQQQAARELVEKQAADAKAAEEAAATAAAERQAAERRAAEQRTAATTRPAPAQPARPTAADLRPVSMPSPTYPREALRSGQSGEVQVEFTVGADGSVTSARVIRADPARTFDRAALEAVQRWRFQPLSEPVTTRRTIGFNPGG